VSYRINILFYSFYLSSNNFIVIIIIVIIILFFILYHFSLTVFYRVFELSFFLFFNLLHFRSLLRLQNLKQCCLLYSILRKLRKYSVTDEPPHSPVS